jgi:hypothetical protein
MLNSCLMMLKQWFFKPEICSRMLCLLSAHPAQCPGRD